MSCTQTLAGLAKDCSANMGGIVDVLIANRDDVTATTLTSGKITAITMAASAKFKRYSFARRSASLTSTITKDRKSNVNFVTSELVMQFNRMETTKRVEITALAVGDLAIICKDANGAYWFLGFDEAAGLSDGDGQTGAASADSNRYQVTIQDESKQIPYEVDGAIVDALVG